MVELALLLLVLKLSCQPLNLLLHFDIFTLGLEVLFAELGLRFECALKFRFVGLLVASPLGNLVY